MQFSCNRRRAMQSNVNTRPDQLQDRISRIAEGVLMLGGAVAGLWLLTVIALSVIR
jgi:hypothetical protein